MRPYLEFDTECAPNWWLIKFYFPMGNMVSYELREDKPQFRIEEHARIMQTVAQFTLVGFNSANYDIPMFRLAMTGAGVHALKNLNDQIIVGKLKRWEFDRQYNVPHIDGLDHVDIMEPTPGVKIGLKTYMARMHSPTIQDLPFDPAAPLSLVQQLEADMYCGNDLKGTRQLREVINKRLKLREKLSAQYGVDMRSRSDAQMSEAIISAQLGYRPEVPELPTGYNFKLRPAPWLHFATPQLQQVFDICRSATFYWSRNEDGDPIVDAEGNKIKTGVNIPQEIKSLRVRLGSSVYKFGIGGLHSQETARSLYSIPGVQQLSDDDVGSFYPSILILLQLLRPDLLAIYQDIYNRRMSSKDEVDAMKAAVKDGRATTEQLEELTTVVDGLKIVLNGSYGKLWSKYSFLCDPEAGIAITINGQLSLLMLIERLEIGGVSVVSANTDGIVILCPAGLEWYRDATVAWWCAVTGLKMDRTFYKSIHSRDVNSYIAIKDNGETKRKGVYSESGVLASMQGVHPDRDIAKDAAVKYLVDGTPIEQTITACADIRKFVLAKSVKGGGQWRGNYLGKTVRWYYSTNGEPITYISNGNKVAGSDGAQPIQVLPTAVPCDVDHAKYIDHAAKLLHACGVTYGPITDDIPF